MSLGRILVLDDNEAIRTAVSIYLGDAGYDVHAAPSLAAALQAIEGPPFDAAAVDHVLPDGTALDRSSR